MSHCSEVALLASDWEIGHSDDELFHLRPRKLNYAQLCRLNSSSPDRDNGSDRPNGRSPTPDHRSSEAIVRRRNRLKPMDRQVESRARGRMRRQRDCGRPARRIKPIRPQVDHPSPSITTTVHLQIDQTLHCYSENLVCSRAIGADANGIRSLHRRTSINCACSAAIASIRD